MQGSDTAHDHLVTAVVHVEGGWDLDFPGGTGMLLYRARFERDVPPELAPRVGDQVRVYGGGFGLPIRGVDLNSRRL